MSGLHHRLRGVQQEEPGGDPDPSCAEDLCCIWAIQTTTHQITFPSWVQDGDLVVCLAMEKNNSDNEPNPFTPSGFSWIRDTVASDGVERARWTLTWDLLSSAVAGTTINIGGDNDENLAVMAFYRLAGGISSPQMDRDSLDADKTGRSEDVDFECNRQSAPMFHCCLLLSDSATPSHGSLGNVEESFAFSNSMVLSQLEQPGESLSVQRVNCSGSGFAAIGHCSFYSL